MWLTDKEVQRLTRKKRPSAQARVLAEAGIEYRMVDNRPLVPVDQFKQQPQHTGGLVLDASLA